ncbi:MAG: PSD1 domain-containing protein [Acidobacteria bacterium]|nr:PSD1 domain-containing protein [Acidobacteriota bacterium]
MTRVLILISLSAFSQSSDVAFFEKNVRPILVKRCYACHSADTKPAGGLRVDDRNGLLNGGDSGPAVIPGEPEKSLLIERITHSNPRRRMPKEGDLVTPEELALLKAWITNGVAWPAETIAVNKPNPGYERLRSRHWAFQPISDPAGDIDGFINAKLAEKGLTPVGPANDLTLIRRLTFDLTGLPPTPTEMDAFQKNPNYEQLVDRLLASPRFGERWGRRWLDVARYGESTGPSRNVPYPHAWRYRDYVIDAFNRDVPFNRFLQEQIAGDLLPANSIDERVRLQIATGFLAIGPKDVNQRFKERFLMDNVDEKIDTVSKAALGLTVSCARCHDHKFDPIPQSDYYALAGIFTSTDDAAGLRNRMGGAGLDYYNPDLLVRLASFQPVASSEKLEKLRADLAVAKKEWEEIRGTPEGLKLAANGRPAQQPFRLKYERLQVELLQLTDPAEYGFAVHGARDGKLIADTAIRIRGEAERLGPTVPRGFLTAFAVPGAKPVNPAQSGRLELAEWLTSPNNPLTPRVAANRIWQALFGAGLVRTVDNFGINGDRPSHPELLDYLSRQFLADGWSTKKLVRRIVLSEAYRRSPEAPARLREADPGNRLLWHRVPRRLEAEEFRDAVLASAGTLDLSIPAGTPASKFKMIEMPDNGPQSRGIQEAAARSTVRSIYLPLLRGVTPRSLEAFDPAAQSLVTGQRDSTTVPAQALFLLNSGFIRKHSLALAGALPAGATATRIRRAYRLILGREPSPAEITRAAQFIDGYSTDFAKLPSTPDVLSQTHTAEAISEKPIVPADPDNIDRTDHPIVDESVNPQSPNAAAWLSFIQALYASAEFRFVN